ncbi:uncharacterized protein LOC129913287 [Episyrphus balteatus]|uniref:uncharacterized protein LOC129913287 n=1 Tax=Episyrphus balteatus TaxID=286459 RepID=UPI0024862A7E|nr:uncharacterized protein LOC129913287 [Episyrphus balteatus]
MTQFFLSAIIISLVSLSAFAWHPRHNVTEKHSIVRRNANTEYTTIVNFWQEHKKELNSNTNHEEVVLVMGNTGAGKTTLVSALVGRKIRATRERGYPEYVDDEGKIGRGTSSKTLVPEAMIDGRNNVTYIDTSGFRDNRNIEYEISSIYFQNILMNRVKKVKFVFVISYDSLKNSGNKNDFDDLLERIGEFIKNVTKFHDGIALVATKVENTYEQSDDGGFFLVNDNQSVLEGIGNYLREKRETYSRKKENPEKYRMFVRLIDALLEKKNNSYSKIAIFRQPTGQGLLTKIKSANAEINAIAKMILENLNYVEKNKDDFGFALSKNSKNTVDRIVSDMFRDTLTNRLYKLGNETLTHFEQIEKQHSDIGYLRDQILFAVDVLAKIQNANEPLELFQNFLNATNFLNIFVSLNNLNIISEDIKALQFFTTVSNTNGDLNMMFLKAETQNIVQYIENMSTFYEFLQNLQTNLDSYSAQKLKHDPRISNIMRSCKSSKRLSLQNIMNLESVVKEIGSDGIYRKISTFVLNEYQLKHLRSVFGTFENELDVLCQTPSTPMIVKGFNIKMSDVVKIDCWSQANNIQIFALNRIFLDTSIDKTGEETQLSIIAPTWEVLGERNIILDGKTGSPHEKPSADSAFANIENGRDGLPGLPGGSAGHFFGIGKEFINADYLHIQANGGKGGPGQNGGKGADGIPGTSLPESFFKIDQNFEEIEQYLKANNYCYEYWDNFKPKEVQVTFTTSYHLEVKGKPAKKPSNGGNGGIGGKGGLSGKIIIHGLKRPIIVKTSNNTGSEGIGGQGGIGGEKTSEGKTVNFYAETLVSLIYSKNYKKDIKWTDGALIPAAKNGKPGININNQKLPTTKLMANSYLAINSYKEFLRMNLPENIKESELRTLIHDIDTDDFINAQYNTIAFVKEFEGLESQYLQLRNEIDFIPFYNSLLHRIEDFAKSEKNLQNKKVLSYIYTATLTKVFTLKKKRKGKTVVNLNKYLSIIESNVREFRKEKQLEIIQNYRIDYEKNLQNKIDEANMFINSTIEPELDRLWDESDKQVKKLIDELNEKKNSTENEMLTLEKNKEKIRQMMTYRSMLLPLKLSGTVLSFCGPIGAGAGVALTSTAAIAEGLIATNILPQDQKKIFSLDPTLKLMSRVTEVLNNKPKLLAEKLTAVIEKLDKIKEDLSTSQKDKIEISQKTAILKEQLEEIKQRKANNIPQIEKRDRDLKRIEEELNDFTNSRKDIVEKEIKLSKELTTESKPEETLKKEKKLEKRLRRINDVQSVLNSAEVAFSFWQKIENDEGEISKINKQIFEYSDELKVIEKLENQVYEIVIPDLRQIEETINEMKTSSNGSSHAKLDLNKWTVRSTLKDVKSMLQKFTHKMSHELQTDLMRFMEKIDEGFSILIDIYDRIDSYSDSVKQANYMAHIVSAPVMSIQVTDSELSQALNSLNLLIQSNILFEKYGIALQAFKQHYFPFAAHVMQKFQLPADLKLNDIESLRLNIIDRIKEMKNHIDESEATISDYSKFIHNRNVFNSNDVGSLPFYAWNHDTIQDDIQKLLNGSEILMKADISKGLNYNSVKFNDIGINFRFKNENLQNNFNSVLRNFGLTMTLVGNNYYRCGERYYFISFDDAITISYNLNKNEDPNEVYKTIRDSHTFLSPYGLWSIRLRQVNKSVSFNQLKKFANESIDMELVGRGYYIEQNPEFNFNVCNEYLDSFYSMENIVKELS